MPLLATNMLAHTETKASPSFPSFPASIVTLPSRRGYCTCYMHFIACNVSISWPLYLWSIHELVSPPRSRAPKRSHQASPFFLWLAQTSTTSDQSSLPYPLFLYYLSIHHQSLISFQHAHPNTISHCATFCFWKSCQFLSLVTYLVSFRLQQYLATSVVEVVITAMGHTDFGLQNSYKNFSFFSTDWGTQNL